MERKNPHIVELEANNKALRLRYLPAPERQRLLIRRQFIKRRLKLWDLLSEICKSKNFGYEDHSSR